ncbi:MAG: ACP phosphodiesterase [Flavobacteriaceae bacterium]|nr:ACP phosphodiesterase [Flavobacteriaceae bacterium]MCY4267542.1 ACP phosphodiesterase [Flavobacteriaceae bacterium]
MNFLAHIYLSGEDPMVGLANLVADKIKGKEYLKYQPKIQKGILLHRQIDHYADSNPLFCIIADKLFPNYRHYSRIIVDMYFDHFLSNHWKNYSQQSLQNYSKEFYAFALQHQHLFPNKIQFFIQRLVRYNWLMKYQRLEDLQKILWQMEQRLTYPCPISESIHDLKANYDYFEELFLAFFKQINNYLKYHL